MNNKRKPTQAAPIDPTPPPEVIETSAVIPIYRQCKICWDRCRGVGTVYSTQGSTRYYKCRHTLSDMPPCGHTWTAAIRSEVVMISHRWTEVDGR